MLNCPVCGGVSLRVLSSSVGMCADCEKQFQSRTVWAAGVIQEELRAAEKCATVKGKAKHLDAVGEALGRFAFYLDKGVTASEIVVGGRPLGEWKTLLEQQRREIVVQDEAKAERLKICPHCHGVQNKPVRRERDCELCGKRIVLHNGEPCTPEEQGLRLQQEEVARKEAQRLREQREQEKIAAMREEALRCQLEFLAQEREERLIDRVQILAALDDRTCPQCRRLHNKVVRLEEAHNFIPAKHCTSEYCRCTFVPHIGGE